ncbi:hypothetical protein AB0J90_30830 [Micromonospora sp. NPDC049523]|uniref:hypothetical protein n=1 Tax=Micromonospora sp. NPDC049523 TaxID=3155921 RepID=UPI00341783D4
MQLQLSVERAADDRHTARLLRSWFGGAFEAMGGRLRESLLVAEPLSDDVLRRRPRHDPYGRPGEVWGHSMTGVRGPRGLRHDAKAFSLRSWTAFLQGLDDVPFTADLNVVTLDREGFPNALPMFTVTSALNEEFAPQMREHDGRWLFLNVGFDPNWLADPAYQKATLAFVRTVADDCNPAYGEISYDRGSGRTAFENVFDGRPSRTVLESRRTLRGYAWLTICPEEVGDRLGGVDGLRAGGAFVEVDKLAGGGYWLLATEDFRDFDQEAAERIFPVLAPALRAGDAYADIPGDPPYYVSRRNAAELKG